MIMFIAGENKTPRPNYYTVSYLSNLANSMPIALRKVLFLIFWINIMF